MIMKKTLTLLLLLATMAATSQNEDKRFTFGAYTEPVAWKDGLNIGLEIEYQMTHLYFKAGIFLFPDLNNVGYTGFYGVPLGYNLHIREWRGYVGLQLGVNIRQGDPNPTAGLEGGIEYYFPRSNFFLGVNSSYIRRGDAPFYGGPEWMFNGGVKGGFQF